MPLHSLGNCFLAEGVLLCPACAALLLCSIYICAWSCTFLILTLAQNLWQKNCLWAYLTWHWACLLRADFWATSVCSIQTWSWSRFNDSGFWILVCEVCPCLPCCQSVFSCWAASSCCFLLYLVSKCPCLLRSHQMEAQPSTLSTVTLGAIIHTTESEVHPVILVFNKNSRSINVKALRKSSLLEVWVLGLRINLGIAQWRAIALPLVSLDRVVQDSSETRPQKRLTPFSRELFKASAQLFVSHLSYSSHCIASVLVPDHEP